MRELLGGGDDKWLEWMRGVRVREEPCHHSGHSSHANARMLILNHSNIVQTPEWVWALLKKCFHPAPSKGGLAIDLCRQNELIWAQLTPGPPSRVLGPEMYTSCPSPHPKEPWSSLSYSEPSSLPSIPFIAKIFSLQASTLHLFLFGIPTLPFFKKKNPLF